MPAMIGSQYPWYKMQESEHSQISKFFSHSGDFSNTCPLYRCLMTSSSSVEIRNTRRALATIWLGVKMHIWYSGGIWLFRVDKQHPTTLYSLSAPKAFMELFLCSPPPTKGRDPVFQGHLTSCLLLVSVCIQTLTPAYSDAGIPPPCPRHWRLNTKILIGLKVTYSLSLKDTRHNTLLWFAVLRIQTLLYLLGKCWPTHPCLLIFTLRQNLASMLASNPNLSGLASWVLE